MRRYGWGSEAGCDGDRGSRGRIPTVALRTKPAQSAAMSSELQKAAEAAMSLSERFRREMLGPSSFTALEEATLGLSRNSALAEAALGIGRWQKEYEDLFKPPIVFDRLLASRQLIEDFHAFGGIERSLRETFDAFSGVGIGVGRSASAITQALDASGLRDTVLGIDKFASTISGDMERSVAGLSRHALASSTAFEEVMRSSEVLASVMASQQSAIAEAFASLSQSPIHELAQLAGSFDLAEWSEVKDIDEVDDEELRRRILALLQVILATCNKALNPAEWDDEAWRGFAFLAFSIFVALNTGYSNEDRARDEDTNQEVSESKLLAEQAADFLSNMHEAETNARRYLDYVSSLPRGEVVSARAFVREHPERSAERIATLSSETPVAIADRSGRWRKIIYRDELTDQLAEGWVWSGSIETLED